MAPQALILAPHDCHTSIGHFGRSWCSRGIRSRVNVPSLRPSRLPRRAAHHRPFPSVDPVPCAQTSEWDNRKLQRDATRGAAYSPYSSRDRGMVISNGFDVSAPILRECTPLVPVLFTWPPALACIVASLLLLTVLHRCVCSSGRCSYRVANADSTTPEAHATHVGRRPILAADPGTDSRDEGGGSAPGLATWVACSHCVSPLPCGS